MPETLASQNGRVEVLSEPLTYERHRFDASYFRDIVAARRQGDSAARARLDRHAAELRVEVPRREKIARQAAVQAGVEYRVNPNRTDGQGGYLSPPLWLIDDYATAPRAGRVLAQLIPNFSLPRNVGSINLPRLTTGTLTGVTTDGSSDFSQDITDALVTSPVVVISGKGDVSMQVLEQSPGAALDHALFKDLKEDYDFQLETQLISGTGTGNQFYGLLNLPTGAGLVNAVTYTSATPTASSIFPYFGQMAAQVGDARHRSPEAWLMRTARWAWVGSGEATSGLPLAVPGHTAAPEIPYLFDDERPSASPPILGWPIYCNDSIAANLGAGTNQDAVIACRPTDMMLFEGAPTTAVMEDVLSGTLQARLVYRASAAALLGRFPTGIATLTGTGMAVVSGY